MAAAVVKGKTQLKIAVQAGPNAGLTLNLSKEVIAVGRGPENDIVLAGDAKVSRQHAEFRLREGQWHVVNLSQKNFMMVNGEKATSEVLEPSDKIQLGDSILFVDFEIEKEPEFIANPFPTPSPIPPPVASMPSPVTPQPIVANAPITPVASTESSVGPSFGGVAPMARPQMPAQHMPPPPMGNSHHGGFGQVGSPASVGGMDPGKKRFYIILAVVAALAWFFLSDSGKKAKKDPNAIRSTDQIKMDIESTERNIVQLKEEEERRRSIQYKKAQENLVRGFRDFQQGQYSRARDSFQVVLNLDPENELAQRYVQLSQIKFDQQVKELMLQGARNREKLNWRLCMDSFSKVMTMLQGRKDNPTYMEAQKYFEACRLEAEGKY